jgi:NADH-quinone oxidoreductase subunit C
MAEATAVLSGSVLAERLNAAAPGAVEEAGEGWVRVRSDRLVEAARAVRDDRAIDGRYLNSVTAIDRYDHFEVVYNITSLSHNHTFALLVEAAHDAPEVPSVTSVWQGAHLQEREAFDLMGVRFAGHPDLKRLFLWEGFPGHPLRKDFLTLPGGFKPGLRQFPNQDADQWGGEFRAD